VEKTSKNMEPDETAYQKIIKYSNLELAFQRAKRRKSRKPYIQEYEQNLKENFLQLQKELETKTYAPRPLETFIIRDPKTRKISKSDFRDRIVHHAICNIIEPIFDKTFIQLVYSDEFVGFIHNGLPTFWSSRVSKGFREK
jgi:retron-type reverse transcriptase